MNVYIPLPTFGDIVFLLTGVLIGWLATSYVSRKDRQRLVDFQSGERAAMQKRIQELTEKLEGPKRSGTS